MNSCQQWQIALHFLAVVVVFLAKSLTFGIVLILRYTESTIRYTESTIRYTESTIIIEHFSCAFWIHKGLRSFGTEGIAFMYREQLVCSNIYCSRYTIAFVNDRAVSVESLMHNYYKELPMKREKMKLTLWEHLNPVAPKLKNWQMVERQDPTIMPGLCLQARGADTIGKVLYSIEGSTFIHGGLPQFSAFIYEAQKEVFFPYFKSEPRMTQEIALDQKLDFKHAVPWNTPEPQVGTYAVLPLDLRESMENKVQEAYRLYVQSELVKPALQQELERHGLVMVSSGGEISFPIIVEKGKEKSTSSDDTIAVLTNFGDGTGKRVRKLEICQKRAEVQLREIYSSLQTRFGYQVEITL